MSRILSYLPPADLLSCTRVSSIWEGQARKFLLRGVSTRRLCCSTMIQYLELMPQNRRHSHIQLVTCSKPNCLSTTVAKLSEANSLSNVTSLATSWTLDMKWGQDFSLWTHFPNLETLVLRPCCGKKNITKLEEPIVQTYFGLGIDSYLAKYSQKPWSLPSVTTLIWRFEHLPKLHLNEATWTRSLLALLSPSRGVCILPNVTTLKSWNLEFQPHIFSSFLLNSLPLFPGTTALSILNKRETMDGANLLFLCLLLQLTTRELWAVRRLEVNLTEDSFDGRNSGWDRFLEKCAPTLEHLTIRGVRNKGKGNVSQILVLPIFQKLEVLKILRVVTPARNKSNAGVPELELRFASGPILNYLVQFPSLTRLEVGEERKGSPFYEDVEQSDNYWLESCLPFLYETFLRPGQSPCETLRFLDIPTGSGQKWRVEEGEDGILPKFKETGSSCPWAVEAEFFDRVGKTFPNLKNLTRYKHYLDGEEDVRSLREEKQRKIKEWLRIGEKFGLLTGSPDLKYSTK